jgi:hypothetical protein
VIVGVVDDVVRVLTAGTAGAVKSMVKACVAEFDPVVATAV